MRTDELERLLTEALREGDAIPVDAAAAERRLVQRETERMSGARPWSISLAAAALIGLLVVASLALVARLGDDERTRPIGPAPRFGLSPSGLPVGTLVGRVDRTEPAATSTVRLVVLPDGTGLFNAGTIGDAEGNSVADHDVVFAAAGPGSAVMRNDGEAPCYATDILTMHFVVRRSTVRITDVSRFLPDCLVSRGLRAALLGTTLRIEPLPHELSPSGLPVGLLTAPLDLETPNGIPGHLRLFVRADGSGQYGVFTGIDGDSEGFDVTLESDGPGQFAMQSDAAGCGTEPAMVAEFTMTRTTVTFGDVTAPGTCLVSREIAAALTGLTARVQPLPESGSLG